MYTHYIKLRINPQYTIIYKVIILHLLNINIVFLMHASTNIQYTSISQTCTLSYITTETTPIQVTMTVFTYNIHYRTVGTHTMPNWVRKIFLYILPRLLRMRRPKIENSQDVQVSTIVEGHPYIYITLS